MKKIMNEQTQIDIITSNWYMNHLLIQDVLLGPYYVPGADDTGREKRIVFAFLEFTV